MNKENIILNIKGLIANDRTEDALTELLGFLKELSIDDDYLNSAILISARFKKLQRDIRFDFISYSEGTIAGNQINFSLLDLLNQLEEFEIETPKKEEYTIQNPKNVVTDSNISADDNAHRGAEQNRLLKYCCL